MRLSSCGTAYVFSQYTAAGVTETQLDVRPITTQQFSPMSADRALPSTDPAAARALARLGREGWELIIETRFARFGDGEPVLMFKRPAR